MKRFWVKTCAWASAIILLIVAATGVFYLYFPRKYAGIIQTYSEIFGVETALGYAVVKTESDFNEKAVSKKGAKGLMQITDATAKFVSEKFFDNEEFDLFDARINVKYGVKYLSYLLDKFKDEKTAVAAYNAGEGNVKKWLLDERYSKNGETLFKAPFNETDEYVKKVEIAKKFYKFLYGI